jgi:hypothetical protein
VRSIYADLDYFVEDRRTILFNLRYEVLCDSAAVRLPDRLADGLISPGPTDGLWQSTCFELFWASKVRREYFEHNFAADGRWASYRFSDYREGMAVDTQAPRSIAVELAASGFSVHVAAPFMPMDGPRSKIGLSAVIEEIDGTKSYWALRHSPRGTPDFHHRDCFALTLGPPGAV